MSNPLPHAGRLFVVAAPSGAGKTSLVAALIGANGDLEAAVSHTTRERRPDEQHGINYFFIDEAQFQAMQANNQFIESARVFGNLYGTSHAAAERIQARGKSLILEIDWQGATQIRQRIPATTIFILPPSLQTLRRRLLSRAQDDGKIVEERMAAAQQEMSHYREFDYVIVNDDFDRALAELSDIIHDRGGPLTVAAQRKRIAPLIAQLLPG